MALEPNNSGTYNLLRGYCITTYQRQDPTKIKSSSEPMQNLRPEDIIPNIKPSFVLEFCYKMLFKISKNNHAFQMDFCLGMLAMYFYDSMNKLRMITNILDW